MAGVRVCPLRPGDLPEVAAYFAALRPDEQARNDRFDLAAETRAVEARMRWQLLENPARNPDLPGGHFLRDEDGRVVGTHLAIPVRFVSDEQRPLGLLSADLRAEPHAARYSGGMFFAYWRMPSADFHYATTANRNAGAFWEQRNATVVSDSDVEFIRPVNLGPFLEELAERRRLGRVATRAARMIGAAAGGIAGAVRSRTPAPKGVNVLPSTDWERLSALAERHRERRVLTNERSAAYLRWRYQTCPRSERNRIFVIEKSGSEAWVALQFVTVGALGRLREARLMDAVIPRAGMDAATALQAVFDRCRDDCDMIRIKGGTVPAAVAQRLGFWTRRLDGPTSYVASTDPDRAPLLRAHLVAADSDSP